MGLFDRLSRVVRANLNDLVSKAEDPEKVLEQAVIDMQEDLIQLRQAVARAIAEQKSSETKYNKEQSEANKWDQRAKLALQKGDETLAREALKRKKSHTETATALKQQLEMQSVSVGQLKQNLTALESKISEAKTKKNMLQARVKAAKAQEEIQRAVGSIDTSSAMSTFERMEQKVIEAESRANAYGELAGTGIESQFAALEAGGDVDDELAMLKAQMLAGSEQPKAALPQDSSTPSATTPEVVDSELEDLRRQIDNL
jgi:phage shock protein A